MNNGEQVYKTSLKLGLIFILALVATVIVTHFVVYAKTSYPINVVNSYLSGALDTNNIQKKSEMVDETLKRLVPYTGNPDWWYPKEQTNMETTKDILSSVSRDLKKQIPVQDREQWMLLPHNDLNEYVNGEVKTSIARISAYSSAYYWNPNNTPMLLLLILLTLSAIGWVVVAMIGSFRYRW